MQGDEQDVEGLLARHLPGLRAFVRLRMGAELRSREESCDLVQSVAREILQHQDRFAHGGEGGFREWLYTTAHRKVVNRLEHWRADKRTARREVENAALSDFYRNCVSPSQHASAREELRNVESAFDSLTEDQREVVIQSRLLGLSHAEIAERMGRTEVSVRALLSRGMARLATHLANTDEN